MATTKKAEQFKAELIEKFPFTRTDYIDVYVSMCVDFASLQTSELIEAVEKVRDELKNMNREEILSSDYWFNMGLGVSTDALDRLITKHKPTPQ